MDSGLGKEAFSIISQGRVDEILNSRPDDRRSIFEEVARVLKYKLRKKKAEHKLVETDENTVLTRVNFEPNKRSRVSGNAGANVASTNCDR
ncbi:Chromosome partition protein Smc [Lysinibacillus sphaericus]